MISLGLSYPPLPSHHHHSHESSRPTFFSTRFLNHESREQSHTLKNINPSDKSLTSHYTAAYPQLLMFDLHSAKPSRAASPNASAGQLPRSKPMPQHGKTCDPDLTFEKFVPPHQLGEDKPAKRMGATWDVVRAIVKLKKPLKKMAKRPKNTTMRRNKRGGYDMLDGDGERLMA